MFIYGFGVLLLACLFQGSFGICFKKYQPFSWEAFWALFSFTKTKLEASAFKVGAEVLLNVAFSSSLVQEITKKLMHAANKILNIIFIL